MTTRLTIPVPLFLLSLRYLDFLERASDHQSDTENKNEPRPDAEDTGSDGFRVNSAIVDQLRVKFTVNHQSCWERYEALVFATGIDDLLTKLLVAPSLDACAINVNAFTEILSATMIKANDGSGSVDIPASQITDLAQEESALFEALQTYFRALADGRYTADDFRKKQ